MIKSRLESFWYWVNARHAIYLNRQAGVPWPWTDDPILQEYKFTNVFRELDTGTRWCKTMIRDPYADHPELFFNVATYRRYNWTDTQSCLGFIKDYGPERRKRIVNFMLKRRAQGIQIFTGAHMLCGNVKDPETGILPDNKVEQIFDISFKLLWEKRKEMEPQPGDTLEQAFNRFLAAKIPGYGSFIAYEVISDLRWTRYLQDASDIMTWANPGPGATRGIKRLYGLGVGQWGQLAFSKAALIGHMRWLLEHSDGYKADYVPAMELREIEHSLCEWDKYMRVSLGEGRPRSRYKPPS